MTTLPNEDRTFSIPKRCPLWNAFSVDVAATVLESCLQFISYILFFWCFSSYFVVLRYLQTIKSIYSTNISCVNNGQEWKLRNLKKLLMVIAIVVTIVVIIVVAFYTFQWEVLLGHIARVRFHMTLAILHVRECGVKGRSKFASCLLKQLFICCLSLCCQPT